MEGKQPTQAVAEAIAAWKHSDQNPKRQARRSRQRSVQSNPLPDLLQQDLGQLNPSNLQLEQQLAHGQIPRPNLPPGAQQHQMAPQGAPPPMPPPEHQLNHLPTAQMPTQQRQMSGGQMPSHPPHHPQMSHTNQNPHLHPQANLQLPPNNPNPQPHQQHPHQHQQQ
eukprot:CAMPEP_0174275900 /NCGR_PEP_ID=MMETSP0439-20130205/60090_1 /TAXON_ID=0 /ORGANISM="Stereomyxa ramosa, Strain Chinc5" /LENGTH=165 /DNA_ID=CAMNT_0015368073 /DNA_START=871 /DNA_END=1368 /DNA_ORIENTATION=-